MLAVRTTIIGLACALCAGLVSATASAQSGAQLSASADARTRELLRAAEARLASADAGGAYALLSPEESRLAGNAWFDYLLGVAALDSGRLSEAIFSLRRALAVEPQFSGAKMELARAYFEAGDFDQARPLFAALLGEAPPPGVQNVIERYLNAIDRVPAAPRPRFRPFIELTGGDDSNANASTANDQFLGFTLNPNNVEAESSFFEGAIGFNWTVPGSPTDAWYLSGRLSDRQNADAEFVDARTGLLSTGFSWQRGALFARAGAEAYRGWRNDDPNQRYIGIDVLFGRHLNERWDLSANLRGGELNYDEQSLKVLDVDRVMYALSATYRPSGLTRFSLEAIGGRDGADRSGSPYSNSKIGARASLLAGRGNAFVLASVGTLRTDYDGLFFGARRVDEQLTAALQVEFRDVLIEGLSIIPRLRYTDVSSDVSLYEYDRTELGLTLRWMPR